MINDQQKILFAALGEKNIKKLPVYYRFMEPVHNSGKYFSAVESKFHNTKSYDSIPFYKPISRMLSDTSDDSK